MATALLVFGVIPGVDIVSTAVVAGAAILFYFISGSTLSDFNTALADASLWSDVQCAIYEAISADGYVTDANFAAVVSGVGGVTYAHADVITAMVQYMNGLEATGLIGLQNTGSLYVGDCSACTVPPSGGAGVFNGTDDYVLLPSALGYHASYGTFAVWTEGLGGLGALFDGVGAGPAYLFFGVHTAGRIGVYFDYPAGGVFNMVDTALSAGRHHVAVTSDGSQWRLYVDGGAVTPTLVGGSNAGEWLQAIANNPSGVRLSGAESATGTYISATVWDMAMYSAALAASDIAALAAGALPNVVQPAELLAWWPFDDGAGTVVRDASGNGNAGSWHGSGAHWGPR